MQFFGNFLSSTIFLAMGIFLTANHSYGEGPFDRGLSSDYDCNGFAANNISCIGSLTKSECEAAKKNLVTHCTAHVMQMKINEAKALAATNALPGAAVGQQTGMVSAATAATDGSSASTANAQVKAQLGGVLSDYRSQFADLAENGKVNGLTPNPNLESAISAARNGTLTHADLAALRGAPGVTSDTFNNLQNAYNVGNLQNFAMQGAASTLNTANGLGGLGMQTANLGNNLGGLGGMGMMGASALGAGGKSDVSASGSTSGASGLNLGSGKGGTSISLRDKQDAAGAGNNLAVAARSPAGKFEAGGTPIAGLGGEFHAGGNGSQESVAEIKGKFTNANLSKSDSVNGESGAGASKLGGKEGTASIGKEKSEAANHVPVGVNAAGQSIYPNGEPPELGAMGGKIAGLTSADENELAKLVDQMKLLNGEMFPMGPDGQPMLPPNANPAMVAAFVKTHPQQAAKLSMGDSNVPLFPRMHQYYQRCLKKGCLAFEHRK